MSKSGSSKGSGGSSGSGKGPGGSSRGPSSHSGPGGNWPSTTGKVSGGDRGNAQPGKKG